MAKITIDENKLQALISEEVKKGIGKQIETIKNEIASIKSTMATKTILHYLIALNIAMLGLIGSLVVKFLIVM